MPFRRLSLLALAAAAPAIAQDSPSLDGTQWAQLSFHERIVIRIPRLLGRGPTPSPAVPRVRWKEKRGPDCITVGELGGAIPQPGAIDFVLSGGRWVRARLGDRCPALDFYTGFYLKPNADGQVCADRDSIRSRSGANCPIRDFRRLVPER